MFGGGKKTANAVSVFNVKPGECFTAPGDVKTELSNLNSVACTAPHTQESYASVAFTKSDGTSASTYPGADTLTNFAQGSCAQKFQSYVGINYLDSHLFFTFLLPSARGWEQDGDRNVVCFVTTTGASLTESVKGKKQ
ncbi:MAG: hypothetical protein QOE71_1828 [Pseudonocardiales bacterium]|jgi:hypothetical protein|nr:hypothetical protein [Pseudonocardiales bacterium]MDQ1750772.1 hypothetical protein [Pseudonocardiales bacterium]